MRGRRRWVVERLRIRPMMFGFGQTTSGVAFEGPCRIRSELARDGFWIEHESLILAQNERWRHA